MPTPDERGLAEAPDEDQAARVFAALADPTRRAILTALAASGPATATELAARLPISRQAVAKQLDLLRAAGLVDERPGAGRRVPYAVRTEPIRLAQSYLGLLSTRWDERLEALRESLDAPKLSRAGGLGSALRR